MKNKRTAQAAFTLIELLVVIAIIALLVSILLPSLNQAKELAKKAVCMSNLKGIASASHTYSAENDGYFVSVDGSTFGAVDWVGYSVWAAGGQDDAAYTEISSIPTEDRPLYTYLQAAEIWKCPADDSRNRFWTDLGASRPEYYHAYGSSYGFNSSCLGNGDPLGLFNKNRGDVTNASSVVEFFEFVCSGYWQSGNGYGLRGHDKDDPYVNLLFTDGHVGYELMEPAPVYYNGDANYTFMCE